MEEQVILNAKAILYARKSSDRLSAIQLLEEAQSPELLVFLRVALIDANQSVRRAAESALQNTQHQLSKSDLLAWVDHPQASVRRNVANVLEELAMPSETYGQCIQQTLQSISSSEALSVLYQLLLDPNASVRKRAATTLEVLSKTDQAFEDAQTCTPLLQRFRSETLANKIKHLEKLMEHRAKEAFPALQQYIHARQHNSLYHALFNWIVSLETEESSTWLLNFTLRTEVIEQSLLQHGLSTLQAVTLSSHAIAKLIEAFDDQSTDPTAHTRAIWLSGELKLERAVPKLRAQLLTPEQSLALQVEVCAALVSIDSQSACKALLDTLQQAEPAVQVGIACSLCMFKREEGFSILLEELKKRHSVLPHSILLDALGQVGSQSLIPLFLDRLERAEYPFEQRMASLRALFKLPVPELFPPLLALVQAPTEETVIQAQAAAVLVCISPIHVIPELDKRLRSALDVHRFSWASSPHDLSDVLRGISHIATETLQWLEQSTSETKLPEKIEQARQRTRFFLPAILAYQEASKQETRFLKHGGQAFLNLIDHCVESWLALNEQVTSKLSQGHGTSEICPERFSTLRGILGQKGNKDSWFQLCEFLDSWPDGQELDLAISYTNTHLESWPTELRQAPYSWFHDILNMQYQPRFQIVRTLLLGSYTHSPKERMQFLERLPEEYIIHMLDFRESFLASREAKKLASMTCLQHLKYLYLFYNNMGAKGLTMLLQSEQLVHLEECNIQSNNIGNKGAILFNAPHTWENLRALNVCSNRISDKGGLSFVETPYLPKLRFLDLTRNNISEEVRTTLAASINLQSVELKLD